jgi:hypothetical protein
VGGQDGGSQVKGYEVGDCIHSHRIIAEARKISDPVVIVKSARHKAQRIVFDRERPGCDPQKGQMVRSGMISH